MNSCCGLRVLCFLALVIEAGAARAQSPDRWAESITKFEQADLEQPVAAGGIVFVGSSSIRLWDTASSFPDLGVLNRGFGGSQIADVNRYADRLVLKHAPRVIVFYAGDNDVAAGKSAEAVAEDFRAFGDLIAERLPKTHLIYLPIKPSPSRWAKWPVMQEANRRICGYLEGRYNFHCADTVTPMLGEDGQPRAELFREDRLHLNDAGYALWTSILRPLLDRARGPAAMLAQGVVYHDQNGNRRFDTGESPLGGIRVSNGRELVRTDDRGSYRLPVEDDTILFVIKPAGWRTPIGETQLPEFYYIHKPQGSPQLEFPGVAPTGPLPASIDFPLYPQPEPEKFQAILFGDPQPRDQQEVDYVAHDVVEELIGTKASFGVTLGDIAFDDLTTFEPLNRTIALLGIPWHNVIGNHDLNFDARRDRDSDETFERVYGPSYYSFDYGMVHFIALDDVDWYVDEPTGQGKYRGGIGPDQLEFLRRDLASLPPEQMVVLMMHIPLTMVTNCQDVYRLIERRPFCLSISAHQHYHEHRFITKADGWRGPEPHHHIINVTVSGSWWSGAPDEQGIPHTTMADGAPNGYSLITFDGSRYTLEFKAARRPEDYQMNIQVPEAVAAGKLEATDVYVNVFNGSERSVVELRWEGSEAWFPLERTLANDPEYSRIVADEAKLADKPWRNLTKPKISAHLWRGRLPGGVAPGSRALQVRTTDMHGATHSSQRIVRVTAE